MGVEYNRVGITNVACSVYETPNHTGQNPRVVVRPFLIRNHDAEVYEVLSSPDHEKQVVGDKVGFSCSG